LESLKVGYHSKDLGVEGRIILTCISRKQDGKMWTVFICLRIQAVGRLL
jgi:hypothetical protein